MKKLLGIVLLIISFSSNHLTYAQIECTSTCRCGSWEVADYGCAYTYTCYDASHLSCEPIYNHCCYYELGYCNNGGCSPSFYFRKCFLDSCNY